VGVGISGPPGFSGPAGHGLGQPAAPTDVAVYGRPDTYCTWCRRKFRLMVNGGWKFCSRKCACAYREENWRVDQLIARQKARQQYEDTPDWQI
jgi:hypothetical protein